MSALPRSATALRLPPGTGTVVLVEGVSDQRAVETLAGRRGRDLGAEGVAVVPMGGATNIGYFVDLVGPTGANLRLAGLCDAAQAEGFRRVLDRAGRGSGLGCFVCDADLEDELIRALGVAAVQEVIEAQGELPSLRILQNQPAHRERPPHQQLHRFLGTRAGRKAQYARLLAEALAPGEVPAPLDRLLATI